MPTAGHVEPVAAPKRIAELAIHRPAANLRSDEMPKMLLEAIAMMAAQPLGAVAVIVLRAPGASFSEWRNSRRLPRQRDGRVFLGTDADRRKLGRKRHRTALDLASAISECLRILHNHR